MNSRWVKVERLTATGIRGTCSAIPGARIIVRIVAPDSTQGAPELLFDAPQVGGHWGVDFPERLPEGWHQAIVRYSEVQASERTSIRVQPTLERDRAASSGP